jgi:hypothetical protein
MIFAWVSRSAGFGLGIGLVGGRGAPPQRAAAALKSFPRREQEEQAKTPALQRVIDVKQAFGCTPGVSWLLVGRRPIPGSA